MGSAAPLIARNAAELRAALPDGGVLLGLDLGTKTIGTALSDAGWRFATAGKTLPRGKFSRDLEALRALASERRVAGIVLGLPLNMDGSEGPRCQATRQFAIDLLKARDIELLDRTAVGKDRAPPEVRQQLGDYPALARVAAAALPGARLVIQASARPSAPVRWSVARRGTVVYGARSCPVARASVEVPHG